MRTLTILTLLSSFLAFGQERTPIKKLSGTAAKEAWATVAPIAAAKLPQANIPHLEGAGIITESEVNGFSQRMTLSIFANGTYVVSGVTCEGAPIRLGEIETRFLSPNESASYLILDTKVLSEGMPGMEQLCDINVFRIYNGSVTGMSVGIQISSTPDIVQVTGEGLTENEYIVVTTGRIAEKATIILGRYVRPAKIVKQPNGDHVLYFDRNSVPITGVMSLTVSQNGGCQTVIIPRNPQVWGYAPPKG